MSTEHEGKREERTATRQRRKTKIPRRWQVVVHNDDYTSMEFVVYILVKHFQKSPTEATHVMLQVHYKGSGVAGVFTRDVAESKVAVVTEEAQSSGMPLRLTAEPEP